MGSFLKKIVMFSFDYDTNRRSQALFFTKCFWPTPRPLKVTGKGHTVFDVFTNKIY